VIVQPRSPGARKQKLAAEARGFNVHAERLVDGRDRPQLERLFRYLARPPLSTERLQLRPDGRLRLELKTRGPTVRHDPLPGPRQGQPRQPTLPCWPAPMGLAHETSVSAGRHGMPQMPRTHDHPRSRADRRVDHTGSCTTRARSTATAHAADAEVGRPHPTLPQLRLIATGPIEHGHPNRRPASGGFIGSAFSRSMRNKHFDNSAPPTSFAMPTPATVPVRGPGYRRESQNRRFVCPARS
jgi:hypothetical protein